MVLDGKKIIGLAVALCSVFIACERSDVITGAGSGVVLDRDGTLTDSAGFVRVNLKLSGADSRMVGDGYSLPLSADPAFSTQALASGAVYVGVSGDGDTLAAHMQYRVTPFLSGTAQYAAADSLIDAVLYFTADSTAVSGPVNVYRYRSDTLAGLAPVNRSNVDNPPIGSFTLGNDTDVDSIPLPDDIARSIFDARTVGPDTGWFAFSIVDYDGPLRMIHSPYIIVHVHKGAGLENARDSIPAHTTRFTAYENAAEIEGRAKKPFSSQLTQRTAVFEIDTGKIVDTLASLNGLTHELVNAVIAVQPESWGIKAGDESDSGNVSYRLLAHHAPLETAGALEMLSLFNSAGSAGASRAETYSAHSVKTPVRSVIENDRGNLNAPRYIYVYLRAATAQSRIEWKPPVEIETVFTPSRPSL